MGAIGEYASSTVFLQCGSRFAERSGGIDDVVHDDAGAILDLTDDVHHFGDIGFRTPFVDDGQVAFETLGERPCAHNAAHIGGDHQQIVVALLVEVCQQHRRGIDVVDRDVEEALDLVGMQIHRQDALYACGLQHVGDDSGGDQYARRARPAILSSVAKIGDGRGDAPGRSAFERIDEHQHFHQVVVGWLTGRLQHEDVLAADIFEQFNVDLTVRKSTDSGRSDGDAEATHDVSRKFWIGVAGEDHQAATGHDRFSRAEINKYARSLKYFGQAVGLPEVSSGWGGRTRTLECRNQNPVP